MKTCFRVTGPLWGESTGHRWIPLTKTSDAELWCFYDLRLNKRLSKQSRLSLYWDRPLASWIAISSRGIDIFLPEHFSLSTRVIIFSSFWLSMWTQACVFFVFGYSLNVNQMSTSPTQWWFYMISFVLNTNHRHHIFRQDQLSLKLAYILAYPCRTDPHAIRFYTGSCNETRLR